METHKIKNEDYFQSVNIRTTAGAAFEALTTKIPLWWGDMDRAVKGVDDEFKVSWGEPFYQFKVTHFEPDIALSWECISCKQIHGDMQGIRHEWEGTHLHWKIEPIKEGVRISLLHQGLVPEFNCYELCSTSWDRFITVHLKHYLESMN